MSYLNPLLAFGREALLDELARVGVSGLIVPDLPLEEAEGWIAETRRRDIELTLLVAPTSDDDRLRRIAEASAGFVYYVSVTGITGARDSLPPELGERLDHVRAIGDKPVAVGFGISRPEQIRTLRGHADGVVVGSRIVETIRRDEDLSELTRQLKQATRSE